MGKPRIYYANPISGNQGKYATAQYMEKNCLIAKRNVEVLRLAEPQVDWICVAPHDAVVAMLFQTGKISIDQILDIDIDIVDRCHGLFAHIWEDSSGAEKEYSHKVLAGPAAKYYGEPEIWKCDWCFIEHFVDEVLDGYETGDIVVPDLPFESLF